MLAVAGLLLAGAGVGTASAERPEPDAARDGTPLAGVRAGTAPAERGAQGRKAAKKAKKRQKKLNRKIKKKIKNGHYVGYRGDGLAIDTYVCAKKIRDDAGTFRNWKVVNAKRTKRGFTAIVESKIKGGKHVFAIAKVRKQWKIGWEYFGEARDLGNVKRTNARKECKKI